MGNKGNKIKSLIDKFQYPRYGPGQMWETMTARIEELGGEVRTSTPATRLEFEDGECVAVHTPDEIIEPAAVISSLPLRATAGIAEPAPPQRVVEAARGLRYRDFLTVALVLDGDDLFPDNWIYIHEPGVRVGRIQNYRSWSPWMVPDQSKACVGLEYFCFQGDDLWAMADEQLVELAKDELAQLGLVARENVERGFVTRVPLAYPMYDADYSERVDAIRAWLETLGNLQQVGRNGLHRYNNSDHSMLTAIRAVDNVVNGTGHDLWAVNAESVYHETDEQPEQPYRRAPDTKAMREPLVPAERT
jgi:protoporphyrinogen oxidase